MPSSAPAVSPAHRVVAKRCDTPLPPFFVFAARAATALMMRFLMVLRMRGIFSVPASGFIGMLAARTGAPLATFLVFGTAHVARVFGTAPDLDAVLLNPRAAAACSGI